jgi:hypothetical protein
MSNSLPQKPEFNSDSTPQFPPPAAQQPYANSPYANTQPQGSNQSYQGTNPSTNGLSIAGLILAFFIPLVGLILSIIGLKQSKENNQSTTLAKVGIILSSIFMVLGFVSFLFLFVVGAASGDVSTY